MSNYKSMAHSIREILEGKQVDPNQADLAKLKKVAKVDETEAQDKLDETALEFGTDAARDKYSNDTPGQTTGIEHDPIQHQHKPELAVDGVPQPGGMIAKPKLGLKEAIRQVTSEKKDDLCSCGCDCGKEVCESCGKRHEAKDVKEEVIDERNTNVKDAGKTKAVFKVGKAKPIPGHPDYKGPQNPEANKKPKLNDSPGNMKEEGKWDETDDGKAYRAMSPEEKHQHKLKKQVMRKSKELKGDKKTYAGSSLVVSPYMNSERKIVGAIGVIGPTRLNYGRIVPLVDYTAQLVGKLISDRIER